jgi:hypothetical protein
MAQARAKLWTQQFASVIEELMSLYDASLVPQDRRDMKFLLMTRNSIAHAHVSLARTYMLYRPSGGERKEREIVGTLGIAPGPDAAKPFMLKLEFHVDRNYYSAFDAIKRLDEVCFERLSQSIGVPHGRMR